MALALVATPRLIPADSVPVRENRYDVLGAILSTAGVSGVIYGLSSLADDRTVAVTAIVVGVAALIGFILVETRIRPAVPLSIFHSALSIANLAALLVPGVMGAVALTLSLFLQGVQNRDALETGMIFLTLGVAVIVAGPVAASMVSKVGPKNVFMTGAAVVTVGVFVLSRISADSAYVSILLPGLVLTGMGFSTFFASSTITVTMDVPNQQQGLVGGLLNTSVQFGTALCIVLLTAIADRGSSVSRVTQAHNFGTALTVGAVIALATTVLILLLLPGSLRTHAPVGEEA